MCQQNGTTGGLQSKHDQKSTAAQQLGSSRLRRALTSISPSKQSTGEDRTFDVRPPPPSSVRRRRRAEPTPPSYPSVRTTLTLGVPDIMKNPITPPHVGKLFLPLSCLNAGCFTNSSRMEKLHTHTHGRCQLQSSPRYDVRAGLVYKWLLVNLWLGFCTLLGLYSATTPLRMETPLKREKG